jgi:hypothetical protein
VGLSGLCPVILHSQYQHDRRAAHAGFSSDTSHQPSSSGTATCAQSSGIVRPLPPPPLTWNEPVLEMQAMKGPLVTGLVTPERHSGTLLPEGLKMTSPVAVSMSTPVLATSALALPVADDRQEGSAEEPVVR